MLDPAPAPSRLRGVLRDMFAALESRNYRLWFGGQIVSLTGTWMQITAQGYLVYDLTGSTAYLGYVSFASGVPSWALMLFGGVVADRLPRRTLLMATQGWQMLLALILAALVATDLVQAWHIVVMALGVGVATAFDAPARQSFVVDLVDRDDLTNAIALNSTMFNAAVIVGPAVGAAIYAALGPAWCFTLNAFSFLAVLGALALMRFGKRARLRMGRSSASELREGIGYAATHPVIRVLIGNLGLIGLLGFSLLSLVPAWAVAVLGGDVRTNGLLLSARGAGALLGALGIAALGRRNVRGRLWSLGSLGLPLALLLFGLSRSLPLSMLAMVAMGWSFMSQANTANALVQTRVPDELRGRVMSVYTLVFFGAMPIGALSVGLIAARVGEVATVLGCAGLLFVASLVIFWRFPRIRHLA